MARLGLGFLVRERVCAALTDTAGLLERVCAAGAALRVRVPVRVRVAVALGLTSVYDHTKPETTVLPLIPPTCTK